MYFRAVLLPVIIGIISTTLACSRGLSYGTGYLMPEPVDTAIERTAWLSRVKLPNSFTGKRLYAGMQPLQYDEMKSALEEALTISTFKYLQHGNYFKEVRLLPGTVGQDDIVLKFEYDRYIEETAYHPAQIPFIVLFPLLPFYVFFNGPVGMAGSDLSGSLIIEDSDEKVLANATSTIQYEQTISVKKPLIQVDIRTKLLDLLLTKAFLEMQNGPGHEE